MNFAHIRIKNILAIEELAIKAAPLTIIRGKNGVGKTGVLEAIRAALGGGKDATLLAEGETQGECVISLDDDKSTRIRRSVTEKGSYLSVTNSEGPVPEEQTWLNRLLDEGYDPATFLMAKEEKQAEMFLQALPLKVTAQELATAVGGQVKPEYVAWAKLHGLEATERLEKMVKQHRATQNVLLKDKNGTIKTLQGQLPDLAVDKDWEEELKKATENLTELTGERQTKEALAEKKRDLREKSITEVLDTEKAEAATERDTAIEAARAAYQTRIDSANGQAGDARTALTQSNGQRLSELAAEYNEKILGAERRVTVAKEKVKQAAAAYQARDFVNTVTAERDRLTKLVAFDEACLTRIYELRSKLLSKSPMPEVELSEGQIFMKGKPFRRENTATRVRIALKLAELRAGTIGLVICDDMINLDDPTFEEFEKQAVNSGLQFVVTRLDVEGKAPLSIEQLHAERTPEEKRQRKLEQAHRLIAEVEAETGSMPN